MTLKLYNTYSKKLEEFTPIEDGKVTMYNCGPTVYSHPHIGNFRSFILADVLRRYLEYSGYEVTQIMNITDVGHLTLDDVEAGEDKLEAAAKREKKDPYQIAEFYMNEFFKLVKLLNLLPAYKYPRATEHIKEQIELAKKLVNEGYAYVVGGNVYFDVTKFEKYGKLSGNTLAQLKAGARIEVNPEKQSPMDFALWKNDPKHIMQWDSPWGKGFPGWHLECSAMAMKYLGETIDIHTGGEDNIFPHHESEIAQSESATGKQFVRYWLHCRHLLVDGKKMSKSEGNFYTVQDILDKGYDPMVLRYALLSAHYRQPLNFTLESLDAAKSAVQRLIDFKRRLEDNIGLSSTICRAMDYSIEEAKNEFKMYMDGDLNISTALGIIFSFINSTNIKLDQNEIGMTHIGKTIELLNEWDSVLGLRLFEEEELVLDNETKKLIQARDEARKRKDFTTSDKIRQQLKEKGIALEDTTQGTKYKRIS